MHVIFRTTHAEEVRCSQFPIDIAKFKCMPDAFCRLTCHMFAQAKYLAVRLCSTLSGMLSGYLIIIRPMATNMLVARVNPSSESKGLWKGRL
eukprot:scaffold346441_cov20-Prasinocladus_malaysianus.AAC.1